MFRILRETQADSYEVELLYDTAFAPGRTALSSYRLRDGVAPVPELCLLVRDEYNSVVGAIRNWPIRVGGEEETGRGGIPALLLGPVAIHPTRQGEGLGAALMDAAVNVARDLGWTRVILVGDEPYYRRFGFRRDLAEGVEFPPPTNPNRILARELAPGAMSGVAGMVRRWTEG
jgi:predicted N-acetyltransferase YhbS